ncbi:hypothetical protein MSPP1_000628 [Malassezia sp. CBS 17886]|nr:hypothetical protein MSPP1_000628 [Malassezia sp. CBS 17886]
MAEQKPSVAFVHPDLGIGGAERLVVDAAVQLQLVGHKVAIITSHYDARHAFEETHDGTLTIVTACTAIPRAVLGRLHLPMAILQQLSLVAQEWLATQMRSSSASQTPMYAALSSVPPAPAPDVFIVDQLPVAIPLLKLLCGRRVLYYCHFPDKSISAALAEQRAGGRTWTPFALLRRMYRLPLDLLEEATTACADQVVANSRFTATHFRRAFRCLHTDPHVVYPGVDERAYEATAVSKRLAACIPDHCASLAATQGNDAISFLLSMRDRPTFISINRFEAKKNIALAIDAFARMCKQQPDAGLRLMCAGGYDTRVRDNIETLAALQEQASALGIPHATLSCTLAAAEPPLSPPPTALLRSASIIFLPSLPGAFLHLLLLSPANRALLYTPLNEHFGIVPLEAMACGLPVLATNTGGPLETLVDCDLAHGRPQVRDGTGLLRAPQPGVWAAAMSDILTWTPVERDAVAVACRERVRSRFSVSSMGAALAAEVDSVARKGPVSLRARIAIAAWLLFALVAAAAAVLVSVVYWRQM